MTATLWRKDGKLVSRAGVLMVCDVCPCCPDICTATPNIVLTLSGAPNANLDGSWTLKTEGMFTLGGGTFDWPGIEDGDRSFWTSGSYEYMRQVQLDCNAPWRILLIIGRRTCCGSGDWGLMLQAEYRKAYTEGTTCDATGDYSCYYYYDLEGSVFTCPGGDMAASVEIAP